MLFIFIFMFIFFCDYYRVTSSLLFPVLFPSCFLSCFTLPPLVLLPLPVMTPICVGNLPLCIKVQALPCWPVSSPTLLCLSISLDTKCNLRTNWLAGLVSKKNCLIRFFGGKTNTWWGFRTIEMLGFILETNPGLTVVTKKSHPTVTHHLTTGVKWWVLQLTTSVGAVFWVR